MVYVDDIIATSNDSTTFCCLITQTNYEFFIEDLGKLKHFLGREITYLANDTFPSQTKYVYDILTRGPLQKAKPFATSLKVGDALSNDDA